ncbi:PREDICTED: spermidine coumaroyl-CoA acyltransferase-like [Camelina sativa]|uniref:Spermidine coumaroyl-CoA acyltransferase-like n=1 Tax=Camelina sativa TaxID=90675 RepID=A0ABM0TXZ9_CAMSA|nr:PREDICTED: spermidine coumaroyl-CoA acyltransferase-like [Camelina sativa]
MQVTKFPCGGFTIGLSLLHALCDGFGVARFVHSLAELAGAKSEPSVLPVWQRERLVREIDNEPAKLPCGVGSRASLLATSPYMSSNDWVTEIISIKDGNIKMLKDTLVKDCEMPKETFTTYEILSSCIWKSRSRALNLDLDKISVLCIVVGIGHVLDPPLSAGYYGNSVVDVYIELTARELHELSISDIVKIVKGAKKKAYDKRYIKEEIINIERMIKEDAKSDPVVDGLLVMTDVRNIRLFGSMDFGWNDPVNMRFLTFQESARNMVMILGPSKLDPEMEGGVRVVMTLPRDAMVKFKQEMDALLQLRPRF